MKPVFISVSEAGRSLGLGLTKTNELIATGVLKSVKLGARRLISIESIEELAAKLMAEQANDNTNQEVL